MNNVLTKPDIASVALTIDMSAATRLAEADAKQTGVSVNTALLGLLHRVTDDASRRVISYPFVNEHAVYSSRLGEQLGTFDMTLANEDPTLWEFSAGEVTL